LRLTHELGLNVRQYVRLLKSLARVELLILDDWGLAPLTSQQGRDLFEIVDDRHGRGSTIVTTDHWHEAIVDPTIADAVLDRLVHTAHRLALDGETLRKPAKKKPASGSSLTRTTLSEPSKRRQGNCPRSSECCPRSIGIGVRNQSERLSAIPESASSVGDIRMRGQFVALAPKPATRGRDGLPIT
jgi:IstB-like ATP binding protein